MQATLPYAIYPCGDHAITIELGDGITADINRKVIALFKYLSAHPIAGVKGLIPSYAALTLVYDVALLKKKSPDTSVYEMMCGLLQNAVDNVAATEVAVSRQITIPVCYDVSLAPDIASLAVLHQLSIDEVIAIHTAKIYRVYMIGFLPGFAYMGSVDKKINTLRKSKPRTLVPAGSVGIAGEQTGIYPFDSPGGWQLIGQTPVQMFAAEKEMPCYLQPGDEIQFSSITLSEFEKLKKA